MSKTQTLRKFCQFTRTASTLDMRDPIETRKLRAARFERKNKTRGKRSVFIEHGFGTYPELRARREAVAPYGWDMVYA